MASTYCFALALLLEISMASPVPEIFPPEADTLSIAELLQKVVFRILELGFLRGIAVCVLVLCCLTGLLIGSLRLLAIYLHHHDTKLWDDHEEIMDIEDDEKDLDEPIRRRSSIDSGLQHAKSRMSSYIMSNPSTPVTKINIHASPRRLSQRTSPSSPSITGCQDSFQSPSTPLRSAFKPSPPSKRFSISQSFRLSSKWTNPGPFTTPSPKSVRWADQIHLSITSGVGVNIRTARSDGPSVTTEAEMDIATRGLGRADVYSFGFSDLEPPPAYQLEPHTSCNVQGAAPSGRPVSLMALEGDTS